jgi:hypothetical protein
VSASRATDDATALGGTRRHTIAADVGSFDDALRAGLVAVCHGHSHLLAHAVRATEPRGPLRPLGTFCGEASLEYAALGNALFRLAPPGTGLTRAAVRERAPVWMPSIPTSPAFVRRDLLVRYGVRSGAAFPVTVGAKIAAVIELLFVRDVGADAFPTATVGAVANDLQDAAAHFWAI